jgi:hypothetical protein
VDTFLKNMLVGFIFLAIWLIEDFVDVRFHWLTECRYVSVIMPAILVLVFPSFAVANLGYYWERKAPAGIIALILIASLYTFIWFVISVVLMLESHIALGGDL